MDKLTLAAFGQEQARWEVGQGSWQVELMQQREIKINVYNVVVLGINEKE